MFDKLTPSLLAQRQHARPAPLGPAAVRGRRYPRPRRHAVGLAGLEGIPLALAGVHLAVSAAAVLWWRVVIPGWVQPVARAYAERLLEAAETLAETS